MDHHEKEQISRLIHEVYKRQFKRSMTCLTVISTAYFAIQGIIFIYRLFVE